VKKIMATLSLNLSSNWHILQWSASSLDTFFQSSLMRKPDTVV